MVLTLLHLIGAIVLTLAHALFLFRGLTVVRRTGRPSPLDRISKTLSQLLLPATILLGFLLFLKEPERGFLPHGLLGVLPLLLILGMNAVRILFRGNKRALRLLPIINLILIVLAMATGFWEGL